MSATDVVGLFHRSPERGGLVVGREVAVDDFTKALLRHGERFHYALFCRERERKAVEAELGPWAARASVRDARELASPAGPPFTAWHDAQFGTYQPFALRARAASAWPVTLVHHTLSYKELLHDSILRLLVAKPRPYDAMVCTSNAAREALRRLITHVAERFNAEHGTALGYAGRYDLIPLGVDTERFRPRDRTARATFAIDPDAFVLLWVGRLSAIDKADLLPLVQAFAHLVRDNPDRKLRLVCAGSDRPGERFGALISQFAMHLGVGGEVTVLTDDAVIAPHKEELYAAADVFVSPVDNVQESFGLTPIEALASGVPQVVADWSGYRDSVVHEETGFLIPTSWANCQRELSEAALFTGSAYDHLALSQSVAVDMTALQRSVQRLIDEPGLAAAMRMASRRRAEEHYAWPVVIRRHEALWSELAEQSRLAPVPGGDAARYATPDYGHFFAAFASRQLDGGTALQLTARGRELAQGHDSLPSFYLATWEHVDPELLKRVLTGLVYADAKGTVLTIGRIVSVMTANPDAPSSRDAVVRHVLFLLKYGVAEVAANPPRSKDE